LLRIANVRTLARVANIAKVDGGPTAIAFAPRVEPTKKAIAEAGLLARNGRLILEEAIADPLDRLARVEKVLGQLAGGRKRA
jgi:transcription-repair coupling factor (superfamily II helicase)